MTAVKAITDDDRAKHLKAIDTHRKTIDRSQRAIRQHLKALLVDGIDDDEADLSLIENDDGETDDMRKAFVVELRKMAQQATTLNGDSAAPWQSTRMPRIFGAR